MTPSLKTIKRLCTLSGNRCAFPGCSALLVDENSDAVLGEICHIRAKSEDGPRHDKSQTDEERNSFANLILLCSMHHTLIDADEKQYTVEWLQQIKTAHNPTANPEVQPIDTARAERLLKKYMVQIFGPVTIENLNTQTVHFNTAKGPHPKVTLPASVIGGSPVHRRYIRHLLDRYKEFAEQQTGRIFRYAAVYGAIKGRFGTTWEWVAVDRFEEFAAFLQAKIDRTVVGKVNRSKGRPNYSYFQDYCLKYGNVK